MYSVAVVALSALVITAAAPTAFAEDRGVRGVYGGQTDGEVHTSDLSVAARSEVARTPSVEARAASPRACRRPAPTSFPTDRCQGAGQSGYSPIRTIDWNAVGPSTDDFAATDDALRLVGARLVATYRF